MKKRIISILMALLTALIMFPQASFASEATDLKAAYEESLAQYEVAVANVESAQQRYNAISALVTDEYNALKTDYGYTDADLVVTETNYNQALQQRATEEAVLETANSALEEAEADYQAMWETLADGAFSFYPWVKEHYPQYSEDIDLALSLLDEGVEDGYINRGDWKDSTALYSIKYSLQVMKQYAQLKDYFKNDESMSAMFHYEKANMTNFPLMAHAQYNAGHSAVDFGHAKEYLKKYRLSENILIGPVKNQTGTPWSFYDGKLSLGSQSLLTVPTTGDTMTYNEWLADWLASYPTVYEDMPWLFERYNPFYRWFVQEKYSFESGDTNVNHYGHFVNVIYKGTSGLAVSLADMANNDSFCAMAHDFGSDYTNLTIDEFESLLDEYVDSIGLVEYTDVLTEAQAEVAVHEGAIQRLEQLITYLNDAFTAEESLTELNEAQAALVEAEENVRIARKAYAAYVPFEVEGVEVQNTEGYVQISWKQSAARATTYSIYRKTGTEDWTLLTKQLGTKYLDPSVVSGTTYDYCIVASNRYGHSDMVKHATITYLSTPTLFITQMFSQYNNIVNPKLEWQEVPGATGYDVYQKKGNEITLATHTEGTEVWLYGSDYRISGNSDKVIVAPINTSLQYYVVAKAESGESPSSNMIGAYVPAQNVCTVSYLGKTYEVQKFGTVLDKDTGEILRGVPTTAVGKVTIRWKPQAGVTQYDVWRISKNGAKKYLGCVTGTRVTSTVTANQVYCYFAVPHTNTMATLFD